MNERIKKLRKELGLTQQEFADKIGMKRNTVASYEINRNGPSNSVISLICKAFNVSETWLRTGEGEMFLKTSDTVLGQLAKELGLDEFMQGVVSEYLKLNTEQRRAVHDFVCSIAAEAEKAEPPTPALGFEAEARAKAEAYYQRLLAENASAELEDEPEDPRIEAKVEAIRRQLYLEKEAAERSSASTESAANVEKLA